MRQSAETKAWLNRFNSPEAQEARKRAHAEWIERTRDRGRIDWEGHLTWRHHSPWTWETTSNGRRYLLQIDAHDTDLREMTWDGRPVVAALPFVGFDGRRWPGTKAILAWADGVVREECPAPGSHEFYLLSHSILNAVEAEEEAGRREEKEAERRENAAEETS